MPSIIRIVIADDHPLFRQGLRQAIDACPDLRVVGEAGDGLTAAQLVRDLEPEVCILDIDMPAQDGLAVARQLRAWRSGAEVIILTMYKEEDLLNAALDLGIKGYVLKESAVSDVCDAVRTVMAGRRYVSPYLTEFLCARQAGAKALRQQKPGLDRLTPAERRILRLIAEDKTSKEIADELGLSPRTVENHRANICNKLDVHGIHGLVKFAYDNRSRL